MEAFRETALLIWTTPVIVALIIAEVLWTHFHEVRAYTWKEALTNCYMAALNGSFDILMRGVVLVAMTCVSQHKLFDLQRGWFYWTALFVLEDFAYYVLHYVDHHCRMFWAVHVTHHSSTEFNRGWISGMFGNVLSSNS